MNKFWIFFIGFVLGLGSIMLAIETTDTIYINKSKIEPTIEYIEVIVEIPGDTIYIEVVKELDYEVEFVNGILIYNDERMYTSDEMISAGVDIFDSILVYFLHGEHEEELADGLVLEYDHDSEVIRGYIDGELEFEQTLKELVEQSY